jgi:hypothetical protein
MGKFSTVSINGSGLAFGLELCLLGVEFGMSLG